MSPQAVKVEEAMGLIKCINLKGLTLKRSICVVHERNRHLTPAAKAFLALLNLPSQEMCTKC